MTTYIEAASAGFKRLTDLWGDGSVFINDIGQGFWHAGNTLQTCIKYLLLLDAPTAAACKVVQDSYDLFDKHRDQDPDPAKWTQFWRDDYGWWGVSLLLAYNHAKQSATSGKAGGL
jgi:hypothetical protein